MGVPNYKILNKTGLVLYLLNGISCPIGARAQKVQK
jgi:hypothetical protein